MPQPLLTLTHTYLRWAYARQLAFERGDFDLDTSDWGSVVDGRLPAAQEEAMVDAMPPDKVRRAWDERGQGQVCDFWEWGGGMGLETLGHRFFLHSRASSGLRGSSILWKPIFSLHALIFLPTPLSLGPVSLIRLAASFRCMNFGP